MDKPLPIRTVLDAVAEAIAQARSRLNIAQSADLDRFLDADGRALTVPIRLQADNEQVYDLPLLAISPPSVLRITEASVEFDVDPADLSRFLASGADTVVAGLGVTAERLAPGRVRLEFTLSPDADGECAVPQEPDAAALGSPLVDLLSAPLLSIHEGRVGMNELQLEFILTNAFEPAADGRPLTPRMFTITLDQPVVGDQRRPTGPVTYSLPLLTLVPQSALGIRDATIAVVFEVLSVSRPRAGGAPDLSGVAHPPDAPLTAVDAPLLHIALKAMDAGLAPEVAERVLRLTKALPPANTDPNLNAGS